MSDTQSTMREFRFLDDKRKTNGLAESEEARWIELGTALGIDLWAQEQATGYWTEDGFWYPYPAAVDPYAAWVAQQQWLEQQIAYWAEQGYYYDPQTGAYYPMQGVDPYAVSSEPQPTGELSESVPEAGPEEVYEVDDSEVLDRDVDEPQLTEGVEQFEPVVESAVETSATFVPSVDDLPIDDLPMEGMAPQEPQREEIAAVAEVAVAAVETPGPMTAAPEHQEPVELDLVSLEDSLVPLETQLEPMNVDPMLEALAVDLLRPAETVVLSPIAPAPAEDDATIEVLEVAVADSAPAAEAAPIDIDFSEEPAALGVPPQQSWVDSTLQTFAISAAAPSPVDETPLIDTEITVETEGSEFEWGAAVSEGVSPSLEITHEEVPEVQATETPEPQVPAPHPSAPLAGPIAEMPAFAPLVDAAPVPVSGEHRVIVHTIEGQVKRGAISDAQLGVEPLKLSYPDGSTESLSPERLKALFFMLAPGAKMPPPEGIAVLITLIDGRQVAGYIKQDPMSSPEAGFFVIPFDNRTNTERIFIFRHAVQRIAAHQ